MNARSPIISVIMAVHNGEPFLRESLDSILSQTFDDFEFIVVDDASTDGSAQTLASYTDSRIVRITNQQNLGLAASLNAGLNAACGSLVARQDADDISHIDRFRQQLDFMNAHPEVGLLGSDYQIIDAQGNVLERVSMPSTNSLLQHRLESGNAFAHPTIMVRREVLEQVGGYREYFRMSQDYDLFLRIAECCELANLSVPLLSFRIHSGSGSRQKRELQLAYRRLAWNLAQKRRSGMPEGPMPDDLLQQYPPEIERLFADARRVSYLYYAAGQIAEAEAMIHRARTLQATKADPSTDWVGWIIDRAHRLTNLRNVTSAGANYLKWVVGLLDKSNVRLSKRQLLARFYAEQAFLSHRSGVRRNVAPCALRAISLNPSWAKNRGLWKIMLRNLIPR